MGNGFTISATIPATPAEIYEAWLNSDGHAAMTGNPAQVDGKVGGRFSTWNGYISGSILALTPFQRIVQAWRTTEFPEEAPDSHVDVLLEETAGGTKIILTHTDMPEDQVDSYRHGWEDYYFKPMKDYFTK
jgi:activator of HSP90 ATPase